MADPRKWDLEDFNRKAFDPQIADKYINTPEFKQWAEQYPNVAQMMLLEMSRRDTKKEQVLNQGINSNLVNNGYAKDDKEKVWQLAGVIPQWVMTWYKNVRKDFCKGKSDKEICEYILREHPEYKVGQW